MVCIEILESRIAPAAIINVSLNKGALTLVGDNGDHEFSVTALDALTFELKATGDTLFKMGDAEPTDVLVLTSALKSLTATLGAGADNMSLVGLSIGGDVKIDGGAGDNTINLSTVSVTRGFEITGGSGQDVISVGGAFSVKKDFILNLADGDNSLTAATNNFQVGGQLAYTGGSGADRFLAGLGVVSIGKDLSLKFGAGDSDAAVAAIASFSVGKNLIFDTSGSLDGETTSLSLLSLSTRIGGDVRVTDGAGALNLNIASTGSTGKINVVSGAGDAHVSVYYLQLKTKAIEFDASASSASSLQVLGLGDTNSATGVKYTGGAGDDSLTVLGIGGTSVIAEMGDGNNTAVIASIGGSGKTIKITGGSGDDNVIVAVVNGSVANIDIQSGSGANQGVLALANAKVSGKISVTHAAATNAAFTSAFLNSKIGSLEYVSEAAANRFSLGFDIGAIPLPIGGLPIGGSVSLANGLTVAKGIRVVTGDGNDIVRLDGATNVKIGQGLALELGAGENEVSGTVSNFVTKSLKVTGGAGTDTVTVGGSGNFGAVALALGAGTNTAMLGGDVVPLAIGSLSFVSAAAADATDRLTLARIVMTGKLSAKFGEGASALRINDSIIGGPVDVDTGAGSDLVAIDTAATNTGTVLMKAATIKLGDGDDALILGGNSTSSLLTTKSTFSADGGSGTNTLINGTDNVFAKTPAFSNFVP